MSASVKTANLGLSAWIGSDKPTRLDFVNDNQKLDTAVGNHINSTAVHLSDSDRERLETPYVVGYYGGNGINNRSITLDFEPKAVFVYKKNSGSVTKDTSGNLLMNSGMAIAMHNGINGVAVSGNNITVGQTGTAVDGVLFNLNASGSQYAYIAFK